MKEIKKWNKKKKKHDLTIQPMRDYAGFKDCVTVAQQVQKTKLNKKRGKLIHRVPPMCRGIEDLGFDGGDCHVPRPSQDKTSVKSEAEVTQKKKPSKKAKSEVQVDTILCKKKKKACHLKKKRRKSAAVDVANKGSLSDNIEEKEFDAQSVMEVTVISSEDEKENSDTTPKEKTQKKSLKGIEVNEEMRSKVCGHNPTKSKKKKKKKKKTGDLNTDHEEGDRALLGNDKDAEQKVVPQHCENSRKLSKRSKMCKGNGSTDTSMECFKGNDETGTVCKIRKNARAANRTHRHSKTTALPSENTNVDESEPFERKEKRRIDKARRIALQKGIDLASGKTCTDVAYKVMPITLGSRCFGQWDTACSTNVK